MKCYVCAQQGKDEEAVAICIVCGMGVCMAHAIRKDRNRWEGGYPFPLKKAGKSIPRILCPYCDEALGSEI